MALYLTPREVGQRWSCSARHVRRLCASGELRAMRLGLEAWRIAVADVEAFEQRKTCGSDPDASSEARQQEARQEVRPPAVVDGFTLPDGYIPCFPQLWGRE